MGEPAKLNYSHEAIARWLLENPDRQLGDCAREFGYTQAWLSRIIHCNAFQAHMAELQRGADVIVMADIPTRLRAVASQALDGLAEAVEQAVESDAKMLHREFLRDTAETTLKALGYGPAKGATQAVPPPATNTQINILVDANVLERARERMQIAHSQEARVIEPETAIRLPAGQ